MSINAASRKLIRRRADKLIRLISVRKATRQEQQQYCRFSAIREKYDFAKSILNPYSCKLMIAIPHYISPEEYLSIERQSSIRHEYRRGLVYAMAGGTDNHDRIAFNLLRIIDNHLGDSSSCRFYSGNVKVNYPDELYYYPDAFVTCDHRDRDDRYVKRYPKLIAEVLSSSTQAFDTADKFDDYRQIDSLEEYVLISQQSQRVECRRRVSEGVWESVIYEVGNRVVVESIGLEFVIAALYRGLD